MRIRYSEHMVICVSDICASVGALMLVLKQLLSLESAQLLFTHAITLVYLRPDIIEKWGPKPFYITGTAMTTGVAALAVVGAPASAAVLGVPVALYWFIGLKDMRQKEHTILRNFPFLGHLRYLLEVL
jgi:hypothetical protein